MALKQKELRRKYCIMSTLPWVLWSTWDWAI